MTKTNIKLNYKKFKCDNCLELYLPDENWTEDKMDEEHLINFGFKAEDDSGSLCEDCYNEFMNWFKNLNIAEKEELEKERLNLKNKQ